MHEIFNNCEPLIDVTPAEGYWLADLPAPYNTAYFDISNRKSFPIELPPEVSREICNNITGLHTRSILIKAIDKNNLYNLQIILSALRNLCIQKLNLHKEIPKAEKGIQSCFTRAGIPSRDKLSQRLFFLYVAKQVVSGKESFSSIASKFNLDKVNVRIWTSIYLTHGEDVFLNGNPMLTDERRAYIAQSHLKNKQSVVFTCASNLIFSRRRLKNILRRHFRSSA